MHNNPTVAVKKGNLDIKYTIPNEEFRYGKPNRFLLNYNK